MAEKTDIFITGVGGQGSLSASTFLGQAATRAGLKVLVGEIHGMAQRGGVVESTVRIGNVYGPIIPDGQADVLIGFEPVETWRALAKVSPNSLIITNTHPLVPASVSMKGDPYPDPNEVVERIRDYCCNVIAFDATKLAKDVGNVQTVNAILLGTVVGTGGLPIEVDLLREVVLAGVPQKALDVNRAAFDRGVSIGQKENMRETVS